MHPVSIKITLMLSVIIQLLLLSFIFSYRRFQCDTFPVSYEPTGKHDLWGLNNKTKIFVKMSFLVLL